MGILFSTKTIMKEISKSSLLFYIFLCISILIGFYYGEDSSGGGSKLDYRTTFPLVENPFSFKSDFDINARSTLHLLECTKKYCPQATFIYVSTNKVYGDTPNKLKIKVPSLRIPFRIIIIPYKVIKLISSCGPALSPDS